MGNNFLSVLNQITIELIGNLLYDKNPQNINWIFLFIESWNCISNKKIIEELLCYRKILRTKYIDIFRRTNSIYFEILNIMIIGCHISELLTLFSLSPCELSLSIWQLQRRLLYTTLLTSYQSMQQKIWNIILSLVSTKNE